MILSVDKIQRQITRHYAPPHRSTTHCLWSSLARKLNLNLISRLHLIIEVQEAQVRGEHAPCQMEMKSGKSGLSETLQNKTSGLFNHNNKIRGKEKEKGGRASGAAEGGGHCTKASRCDRSACKRRAS